jgi:hypothetical protein
VFGGGAGYEGGGGVDGEGAAGSLRTAGDGQHGGIVDGVAEDGVRHSEADAGERGDFALVGGHVEQGVGGQAGGVDGDAGGKDAAGGNVEALDAFFDDPVAGGADGPDLDSLGLAAARRPDSGRPA